MSGVPSRDFKSFDDFWPYYLNEHSHVHCRLLHFMGTTSAITFAFVAVLSRHPVWFIYAAVVGYGFAWWSHYTYEKNRPATFKHPFLSFLGDIKMFWMMYQGTLDSELDRLQIVSKR